MSKEIMKQVKKSTIKKNLIKNKNFKISQKPEKSEWTNIKVKHELELNFLDRLKFLLKFKNKKLSLLLSFMCKENDNVYFCSSSLAIGDIIFNHVPVTHNNELKTCHDYYRR